MNLKIKLSEVDTESLNKFITKNANEKGCWFWTGDFFKNKYPRFYNKNDQQRYYARPTIYKLYKSEIPDGLFIIGNSCKIDKCVNPDHVLIGSPVGQGNLAKKETIFLKSVADLSEADRNKIKEELFKDVDTSNPDACWTRNINIDDRGFTRIGRRRGNYVTYELEYGKIPAFCRPVKVCSGPNHCINPKHWKIQQIADAKKKTKYNITFETITPEDLKKFNNGYTINGETGCWLWNGIKLNQRKSIRIAGQNLTPYRLSAILHLGYPPSQEYIVRHLCNTPACVNPFHLKWGTPKENNKDKKNNYKIRGYATGIKNAMSSFSTDEEVYEVYQEIQAGKSVEYLAEKYKKTVNIINNIKNGNTFNEVTKLPKTNSESHARKSPVKLLNEMTKEDITEFWSKTKSGEKTLIAGVEDSCLLWTGATVTDSNNQKPRGIHYFGGKNYMAYHISHFLMNGKEVEINDFHCMRHLCRNPLCVKAGVDPRLIPDNPERFKVDNTPTVTVSHVVYGTKAENSADEVKAGVKFGNDGSKKHNRSIQDDETILEVVKFGELGYRAAQILEMLEITDASETVINRILSGETFSDLTNVTEDVRPHYNPIGIDKPATKVSPQDIFDIRQRKKNGEINESIAERYNIDIRTVTEHTYNDRIDLNSNMNGYIPPLVSNPTIKIPTDSDEEKVKNLAKDGKKPKFIAIELGIKLKRVRNIINKLQKKGELPMVKPKTKVEKHHKDKILKFFNEDKKPSECYKDIGLGLSTVEKEFKKLKDSTDTNNNINTKGVNS